MIDRKTDDPIGYTYKAEEVCDVCLPITIQRGGLGHNPIPKETVWEFVQIIATYQHVNIEDESSYDSGDFPKPIWPWMETKSCCALCREPLDEEQFNEGRWLP